MGDKNPKKTKKVKKDKKSDMTKNDVISDLNQK
jgi:hypothetical protein